MQCKVSVSSVFWFFSNHTRFLLAKGKESLFRGNKLFSKSKKVLPIIKIMEQLNHFVGFYEALVLHGCDQLRFPNIVCKQIYDSIGCDIDSYVRKKKYHLCIVLSWIMVLEFVEALAKWRWAKPIWIGTRLKIDIFLIVVTLACLTFSYLILSTTIYFSS